MDKKIIEKLIEKTDKAMEYAVIFKNKDSSYIELYKSVVQDIENDLIDLQEKYTEYTDSLQDILDDILVGDSNILDNNMYLAGLGYLGQGKEKLEYLYKKL
jgi:hypothetical protein